MNLIKKVFLWILILNLIIFLSFTQNSILLIKVNIMIFLNSIPSSLKTLKICFSFIFISHYHSYRQRSHFHKIDHLQALFDQLIFIFDIICFIESWLSDENKNLINMSGYLTCQGPYEWFLREGRDIHEWDNRDGITIG